MRWEGGSGGRCSDGGCSGVVQVGGGFSSGGGGGVSKGANFTGIDGE